jgi:hypothetical protein
VDKRFADFPALSKAIRKLYQLFGRYRSPYHFGRNLGGSREAGRKPLMELGYQEMHECLYSFDVEYFKHFVPRLCEITALRLTEPITSVGGDWMDLWQLCGGFRSFQWHTWPNREQAAVQQFFIAFFDVSLGLYPNERPEEYVRDLGEAGIDVAILLQSWAEAKSLSAALQLAEFISTQAEDLFRLGGVRLTSEPVATAIDEQVTAWLAQPQRRAFLEEMFFQHSDDLDAARISEAVKWYDWWKELVVNKA